MPEGLCQVKKSMTLQEVRNHRPDRDLVFDTDAQVHRTSPNPIAVV